MNKIKINSETKVYVLSPAFHKTGGTELLHQYVDVLLKNNIKAYIVYLDATEEKNINPAFKKYISEYKNMEDIEDDKNNILVLPEIYTGYISNFKNIRIALWWESVDNYIKYKSIIWNIKTMKKHYIESFKRSVNIVLNKFKFASFKTIRNKVNYHFVQSYYAKDFVIKNKLAEEERIYFVSDYINDLYLSNHPTIYENKEDFVCYNPIKGYKFTKKLIKRNSDINFVPLVNMTNEQVFDTLKRAKVYIDFGEHPGKDRFPREAAIMGCIVITNKVGAAKYHEDIPIEEKYKFDDKNRRIPLISKTIKECISNYGNSIKEYEEYRKMILEEKDKFFNDVISCYELEK